MGNDKYQNYACIDFLRCISGLKGSITRERSFWGILSSSAKYSHIIDFHKKLEEIVEAVDNSGMGNGHGQKEAVYRKVIEAYQHLIIDRLRE